MTSILLIEDDDSVRDNVTELLQMEGYEVIAASDGPTGIDLALRHHVELIICDVNMPGMDGFEVFEVLSAHSERATTPFIFLSARAAREDMRRGMVLGADDYLTKPFSRVELLDAIATRLRKRGSASEHPASTVKPTQVGARAAGLIFKDAKMQQLCRDIERAAPSTISILLLGQTGVGKEILARKVHEHSGRRGQFVALNCAALTESLLESELFGHEKGAFTGAVQGRAGLIETAEGGTLFLDEVGELPLSTQVKLLRVLEDREVVRVGGRSSLRIDVRFVSATNRNVEELIEDGVFRQDLFYRINGMTLDVPALRERAADILALAEHFMRQASPRAMTLSSEVRAAFLSYPWPGNIRELRNVMERALLLCTENEVRLEHLPVSFQGRHRDTDSVYVDPRAPLLQRLESMERQRIVQALEQCGGNQTQAAQLLGMSRRTFVNRVSAMGLPRPRKRW